MLIVPKWGSARRKKTSMATNVQQEFRKPKKSIAGGWRPGMLGLNKVQTKLAKLKERGLPPA